MRMLMTFICTFGVTRRKRPQRLIDLKCALQTCNAGWKRIHSSLMPIKQSFSGPGLDMVRLFLDGSGPSLDLTISSDLSLEKYVAGICSTCFYWLGQIRRIRRSLDTATTLVHAFIASRVDYCNTVLARSPRFITDRLQRVLNAAARVITGTRKFDRGLSDLLHSELHWLVIRQCVQLSSEYTTYRCFRIVLLST